MRRKIDSQLDAWMAQPHRKPLLVDGVRQVGKTYSILAFARRRFRNVVHVDFSARLAYRSVFEDDISPRAVVPRLEALVRTNVDPADTLLFFDEVQLCPRALTALKYFAEEAPDYHVVAAGSLLGVTPARGEQSYPVGKVDLLRMRPMDFEEYLWACGEDRLADLIRSAAQEGAPFALHDMALGLWRAYLICGGMPEVVLTHSEGGDARAVETVQDNLLTAYVADMTKHAGTTDSARILAVWDAVPEQLAKENHKFQFATIASSARAHQYEAAIGWLVAAGMLEACYRVSAGTHPLRSHAERDFFKLYLADCGLLARIRGVDERVLLESDAAIARPKGALVENYVMQQLCASGCEPFYWGTASKAKVDFVLDVDGEVIPLEVKAGTRVHARSLERYRRLYGPSRCIRVSARNFGTEGELMSVPLYATHCLRGMLEARG